MSKAFVKEVDEIEKPVKSTKITPVVEETPAISMTIIGVIVMKNKMYQLLAGDDKKWYKQESTGYDEKTRMYKWSNDCKPFTKKEFESYFGKQKK